MLRGHGDYDGAFAHCLSHCRVYKQWDLLGVLPVKIGHNIVKLIEGLVFNHVDYWTDIMGNVEGFIGGQTPYEVDCVSWCLNEYPSTKPEKQ